ncbi:hypothetical protein RMR16_002665 [Agrobacterium sp. rho-13.3]|uniref:hypothetical protein n=1 Tax=Agrobacterium sp. rho-13.3 TaxID=3072980 RepID=UPI002A17E580|nr:hypothetical protein [Agrobacterium sp. rho-13.3]MDX8308708.1 hypothetical protein [Agrobacterium sp. rho-13.3]
MNIDNNIGGSAHQNRSQHLEKRQSEAVVSEQLPTTMSGDRISFVNVLQATSLANVLWTVNNEAADGAPEQGGAETSAQLESAWLRQAYTEH